MRVKYPKMKSFKKIRIFNTLLKFQITILIGNYKDIKKFIPKDAVDYFHKDGYFARCAYGFVDGGDKFPHRIVIHSRTAAMATIAHEVIHAGSFIFSGLGVKADWDNDELLAYFVQYVLEKVEDELNV